MSNTGLIIEERARDIGDFMVGRVLPFRQKRMVGPFIFLDHLGPTQIGPGHYKDIGQHPHIGLSTLTYLLEGEIMHRDSLGTVQRVVPGTVGWMTAGKGIVHTERTPHDLRDGGKYSLHGFQIWVALPDQLEDMDPEFSFTRKEQLPTWTQQGIHFKLIAGKGYQKESPVPVYCHLFLLEVRSEAKAAFDIHENLTGEIGVFVVEGYIEACGQRIDQRSMLVSKKENACKLVIGENTTLLVLGGEPFETPRFIDWNFVSTSKEKIAEAKSLWQEQQYRMVPDEVGFVPLPKTLRR
jgi:redox-sensitive bicupin YhaK (pirin superfamily)